MVNKKIMLKPQKTTSGSLHKLTIARFKESGLGYDSTGYGNIKPNTFILNGKVATINLFWTWKNDPNDTPHFLLNLLEKVYGNVVIRLGGVEIKGQFADDKFFNGTSFSVESNNLLYDFFDSNAGKTVDVWIDGGGVKRFLHRLFATLCGGLCYAEQGVVSKRKWKNCRKTIANHRLVCNITRSTIYQGISKQLLSIYSNTARRHPTSRSSSWGLFKTRNSRELLHNLARHFIVNQSRKQHLLSKQCSLLYLFIY